MTDISRAAVDALLQGVAARMRQHTGPTEIHELVSRTDVRDALRAALDEAEAALKTWPEGFFNLTGDTLHLRCATEGCGQCVSARMEVEGIGSDYCEPCILRIIALTPKPVDASQAPDPAVNPPAAQVIADAMIHGAGIMQGGHRIDPQDFFAASDPAAAMPICWSGHPPVANSAVHDALRAGQTVEWNLKTGAAEILPAPGPAAIREAAAVVEREIEQAKQLMPMVVPILRGVHRNILALIAKGAAE